MEAKSLCNADVVELGRRDDMMQRRGQGTKRLRTWHMGAKEGGAVE